MAAKNLCKQCFTQFGHFLTLKFTLHICVMFRCPAQSAEGTGGRGGRNRWEFTRIEATRSRLVGGKCVRLCVNRCLRTTSICCYFGDFVNNNLYGENVQQLREKTSKQKKKTPTDMSSIHKIIFVYVFFPHHNAVPLGQTDKWQKAASEIPHLILNIIIYEEDGTSILCIRASSPNMKWVEEKKVVVFDRGGEINLCYTSGDTNTQSGKPTFTRTSHTWIIQGQKNFRKTYPISLRYEKMSSGVSLDLPSFTLITFTGTP